MNEFNYPALDDYIFSELRQLAGITLAGTDQFEDALVVAGYTHTLFSHDGDNTPSSFDALTILNEAQQGESFRCVEYSIAAQGLLWSYGIPARVVGLKTADVETREYGAGHVVIELWHTSQQKWVMCDVQWGVLPSLNGQLLSAYELGQAIGLSSDIEYVPVDNSRFKLQQKTEYTNWIREYLHFYDTDLQVLHSAPYTDLAGERKLMLVPNDATPPKMFQGMFKMNLTYTTDPADFYPELTI